MCAYNIKLQHFFRSFIFMNLSTILPLLNSASLDPSKASLIKLILEGKQPDVATLLNMMQQNNAPTNTASNNPMQLANMVSMLNSKKNTKSFSKQNPIPRGLKPICHIAPDIILARLVRYFNA